VPLICIERVGQARLIPALTCRLFLVQEFSVICIALKRSIPVRRVAMPRPVFRSLQRIALVCSLAACGSGVRAASSHGSHGSHGGGHTGGGGHSHGGGSHFGGRSHGSSFHGGGSHGMNAHGLGMFRGGNSHGGGGSSRHSVEAFRGGNLGSARSMAGR